MNKIDYIDELKEDSNLTYSCQYIVAFCTKHNRKLFNEEMIEYIKSIFKEISNTYSFNIKTLSVLQNHVLLTIECNPSFGITNCITKLKKESYIKLIEKYPELKKRIPTIWTRKAMIKSIGTANYEDIANFIERQKCN